MLANLRSKFWLIRNVVVTTEKNGFPIVLSMCMAKELPRPLSYVTIIYKPPVVSKGPYVATSKRSCCHIKFSGPDPLDGESRDKEKSAKSSRRPSGSS